MPTLFDRLRAGDLLLPNRIVMAPLTCRRTGARTQRSHGEVLRAVEYTHLLQRRAARLRGLSRPGGVATGGSRGLDKSEITGWRPTMR
jgi:2,4-dienoyl-CoA reductase-like NADH-dependent reductase (Old Yellow Enzyme family)